MPLFGPPNVEKLKAKGKVDGLIKALSYEKDDEIRKAAARALGEVGDSNAVEPLIAALQDQNVEVRQSAVEALGQIGDARAIETLMDALKNKRMQPSASEALARIGVPAIEPLIVALKDHWVRKPAADVLAKIGAPAIEPLTKALRHMDHGVCRAAAGALGEIGGHQVVEPLISALGNSRARPAAVDALAQVGDPAVGPLIVALQDKRSEVRRAATEALEKGGWQPDGGETETWYWIAKRSWHQVSRLSSAAVNPLLGLLQDEDVEVRKAAAGALAEIDDPRVVEPIIAMLKEKHSPVRQAAADALVKIGAPAVEPLISALKAGAEIARRTAAGTLGRIGDPRAVEPLGAALQDKRFFHSAAAALAQIGDSQSVKTLATALENEDRDVRAAVAKELGQTSNPQAVVPLVAALQDSDYVVFQAVIKALADLYRSGTLSDVQKQAILQQETHLVRQRSSQRHIDADKCGGSGHEDEVREDVFHADFYGLIEQ